MKHFTSKSKQKRRRLLTLWANRELNARLDAYMAEHNQELREKYLEAGYSEENIDRKLAGVREKAQIALIKRFKVELRAGAKKPIGVDTPTAAIAQPAAKPTGVNVNYT